MSNYPAQGTNPWYIPLRDWIGVSANDEDSSGGASATIQGRFEGLDARKLDGPLTIGGAEPGSPSDGDWWAELGPDAIDPLTIGGSEPGSPEAGDWWAELGDNGAFVPSGGTTDQVLAKASNTNFDLAWADNSGGNSSADIPSGGDINQVLKKLSGDDYDVGWANESAGGSGSEPNVAMIVVAASDAPQAVKDASDYVCDGTNDEVTINAANTASLLQGTSNEYGGVKLSIGTFYLSAPIFLKSSGNSIIGSGLKTVLQYDDGHSPDFSGGEGVAAMIKVESTAAARNAVGFFVQGLSINCGHWNGSQWTQQVGGIRIDQSAGGTTGGTSYPTYGYPRSATGGDTYHRFVDLYITNTTYGMYFDGTGGTDTRGNNCHNIRMWNVTQIGYGGTTSSDNHFNQCHAITSAITGAVGFECPGGSSRFTGCKAAYFDGTGEIGFNLNSSRALMDGCEAQDCTKGVVVGGADTRITGLRIDTEKAGTIALDVNADRFIGTGIVIHQRNGTGSYDNAIDFSSTALDVFVNALIWSDSITKYVTVNDGSELVGNVNLANPFQKVSGAPNGIIQVHVIDDGSVDTLLTSGTGSGGTHRDAWLMPSHTDGTRPGAGTVPAGYQIWNTTDDAPQWSDGTSTWVAASGASSGPGQAILVAAHDAPQAVKDAAQYVCTGADDEVDINNAFGDTEVNTNQFGTVELSQGEFVIDGPILIPGRGARLTGAGWKTLIMPSNSATASDFDPGNDTNATEGDLQRLQRAMIKMDTTAAANAAGRVMIDNLWLMGSKASAPQTPVISGVFLHQSSSTSSNQSTYATYGGPVGVNGDDRFMTIRNVGMNHIRNGIYIHAAGDNRGGWIDGCIISYVDDLYGIGGNQASDWIVSNNQIDTCWGDNTIGIDDMGGNTRIVNNKVYYYNDGSGCVGIRMNSSRSSAYSNEIQDNTVGLQITAKGCLAVGNNIDNQVAADHGIEITTTDAICTGFQVRTRAAPVTTDGVRIPSGFAGQLQGVIIEDGGAITNHLVIGGTDTSENHELPFTSSIEVLSSDHGALSTNGPLTGPSGERPTASVVGAGKTYWDTSHNELIVSNGTGWVAADGSAL